MSRHALPWLAVAILLIFATAAILFVRSRPIPPAQQTAQTPRGPGAMGGGGGERFAEFRETHRFTFQLTGLAGNIARLEQEEPHALTAAQARDLLAILQPLRTQTTLTQDDAKEAIRALQAVLTEEQRTTIGTMQPERRGGGGGPRGEGGRGGNGERPAFDPEAMTNFNPFNPASTGPMGGRGAARWDALFTALETKAES